MISPSDGASTSRSRTASSAWSTATASTSGCANAPQSAGAARARHLRRMERDPTACVGAFADARAPTDAPGARCVIGADGARSAVARQAVPGAEPGASCSPTTRSCARRRARGRRRSGALRRLLPRQPVARLLRLGVPARPDDERRHRQRRQGLSLRAAVGRLREAGGLTGRDPAREGAPIPMKPLPRWDDGRDVVLGAMPPASCACLGRGHLLRDAGRAAGRRGRARLRHERRPARPGPGAQALHARARPRVLGAGA